MSSSSTSFYHLGIAPQLLKHIEKLRFVQPTPIQLKAIPVAIEGKDIFGVAQTGTGKTLAFGIPTIQRLAAEDGGRALVLVPTRELALQVEQALKPFLNLFHISSVVLIGGVPIHRQFNKLAKKPRFIIATPGRLIDHMRQKKVKLDDVETLVLDEADRMFDMGFKPQIEEIIRKLKKKRQTLLFSATMPEDIMKLATQHMKLPIRIEIAPPGTAADRVSQELFIVKEEKKKSLLKAILGVYRGSVLVFVRTKVGAKRIKQMISVMGYKVAEIHSNRSMGQRKLAIEGFKKGRFQILVATDIAARGIDVNNIELVLNYDMPEDVESYVHRIGRTGRAGSEGHAVSFARPDQGAFVSKIQRITRKKMTLSRHGELSEKEFDLRVSGRPKSRGYKKGRRSRASERSKNRKKRNRRDSALDEKPGKHKGKKRSPKGKKPLKNKFFAKKSRSSRRR